MRKTALTATGLLASGTLLAVGMTAATAQPSAADQAPECVTVVVLAPQADGTTARVHLSFCGGSPGADSALHDWAANRRFVLDGARRIGGDCGAWSDPCTIFPR